MKHEPNWTQTFLESFDEDIRTITSSYGFILKVSFYVVVNQSPYKLGPPTDTELIIYRIYSQINCEDFKHQQWRFIYNGAAREIFVKKVHSDIESEFL